jgi:hypothetical protein
MRRWIRRPTAMTLGDPRSTLVIAVVVFASPVLQVMPVAAIPEAADIRLSPTSGPPSSRTTVTGEGFAPAERVDLFFDRSPAGSTTSSEAGGETDGRSEPSPGVGGSSYGRKKEV